MRGRRNLGVLALAALALLAAACGNDGGTADGNGTGGERSLTVYSGRDEGFVGSLFEDFEEASGIDVEVRYGDSAELAATILEEDDASPADVFWSQDAGSLGAVGRSGLLAPIPPDILDRVERRFRDADGTWVGVSGRGRVAAYNTELVDSSDLPASVHGFTDPAWRGRIAFPPTNSSFQAFVAAMILAEGEDATREFLGGLVANEPRLYEDNGATVRAIAAGEVEVGLVNHYYVYEVAAEEGAIPVENHYFEEGDAGALVNVAGVGILASADHPEEARAFVDYLTGEPGQTHVAEGTWEYPVVAGYEPTVELLSLDEFRGPDVDLSRLGDELETALRLLAEVGLV